MSLEFSTLSSLHDAFDAGKTRPSEIVKGYLDRIRKSDHNAFLTLCEERATAQAREADAVLAKEKKTPRNRLPLFGLPLGVKDVLTMEGVRTTCASKILDNYVPPYTGTAMLRLEQSGAIPLGKLNMDEFAMGSSNENSAYGAVKHPTHSGRVPGGSSGASATAVKAGLCHASLGTDTGGSIRLPASFCGIVGLKPTYGRISRYGLVAFASSLDQIGPMTHSVEDAAALLQVMAGHDPMDSTSSLKPVGQYLQAVRSPCDWKGLRVGVPSEYFGEGLAADVRKTIESAIKLMEKKGAKIVPVQLKHTKYAVSTYYIVAASEASSNLSRFDGVRFGVRPKEAWEAPDPASFYKKVRGLFGPEVKRRIILGTFALSSGYYDAYYQRACQVRRLIKQDFDAAFQAVDLIVGPVAPTTAFKIGEKTADPLQAYLMDILTIPASLSGLPGLSLPCGAGDGGLPIGLQMLAPHFQEERLLNVASALEKELQNAP